MKWQCDRTDCDNEPEYECGGSFYCADHRCQRCVPVEETKVECSTPECDRTARWRHLVMDRNGERMGWLRCEEHKCQQCAPVEAVKDEPCFAAVQPPRVMLTRPAVLALEEAESLVSMDRREVYGDAKDNFDMIAALWEAAFGWSVDAGRVALAMDLVKTSRLAVSPNHWDSWVDKAGYSALGAEVTDAK